MPGDRDVFRAPNGTHDVLPPESDRWQALVAAFATRARRAGFGLLVTPIFEHIEVVQKLGLDHRRRAQGDVRLRRQGRPAARAARRRHRVGRAGVRAAPAGHAVEGLVRRAELPLRAAAEGPVPPALAGRRRGARCRRPDVDVEVIALAHGFYRDDLGLRQLRLLSTRWATPRPGRATARCCSRTGASTRRCSATRWSAPRRTRCASSTRSATTGRR